MNSPPATSKGKPINISNTTDTKKKTTRSKGKLGSNASNDSKAQLLEYVVKKRVDNLDYIRRVHEGKAFWLNTVKITPQDIQQYYHPQTLQKRVQQWFYMGVSIAPLLQLENGYLFVRSCAQLMEEYEYHFSNVAVQGMKILKALTVSANEEDEDANVNRPIKPVINKVGGTVVYEFLRTPNIPCVLDYCQVVFSLCDILTFVYRKLMDESSVAHSLHESIIKLDGRFKHHFFGLVSRDLNTLGMYIIKSRLCTVESLFDIKKPDQQVTHQHVVMDQPNQSPQSAPTAANVQESFDEYFDDDDYEEYVLYKI
ncbi:hypothetical protein AKO1_003897 [Acrasis kona]|uniref:Uncharacterized protein n=1 Tax=Acrasis kona TaxID=1008807 RepID=A0AAW2ZHD3_9EUKA